MSQILVKDIIKDYKVRQRDEGCSKFKNLVYPKYEQKRAVDNISFEIESGEMVGYIGSNGAGKSTTIKMLTGILTPTSGEIRVFGKNPVKNRKSNASKMGVVFGQRSQLLWDLPVRDTFELFKMMYRMDPTEFIKQRDRLIEMLDMQDFLNQAVRQLSLGQRMRANLAMCFLYKPEVVYLDEPTIGLDVLVKEKIRTFLRSINKEQGTTILLTTHDTQDIEEIAERIILIDEGRLLFDGSQSKFTQQYQGKEFLLSVEFTEVTDTIKNKHLHPNSVVGNKHNYWISYDKMTPGEAISFIAKQFSISDIKVREKDIEGILKDIYSHKR